MQHLNVTPTCFVHIRVLTHAELDWFINVRSVQRGQLVLQSHIEKEGNVLLNDTLSTFYFTVIRRQTYGKRPFR